MGMNVLAFRASPRGADRLRILPIVADDMVPTLHPGDVALVAPAERFGTDGLYTLDDDGVERVYRVAARPSGLLLIGDNPLYGSPTLVSRAGFANRLTGQVVVACRVLVPELIGCVGVHDFRI